MSTYFMMYKAKQHKVGNYCMKEVTQLPLILAQNSARPMSSS